MYINIVSRQCYAAMTTLQYLFNVLNGIGSKLCHAPFNLNAPLIPIIASNFKTELGDTPSPDVTIAQKYKIVITVYTTNTECMRLYLVANIVLQ